MNSKKTKIRLDRLLVERGLSPARERARALIMSGSVLVDENIVDKAGTPVFSDATIRIKGEDNPYVSRGGLKIKGALEKFDIDVRDFVVLDVGVSTGGFTDCLLQEGAKKVYAVDVGYGQLAWKLRTDERVILFERENIRYFSGEGIEDEIDLASIDVSFISLKLVLPAVISLIKDDTIILALIKPQFEAGKGDVGKKGVVRDPEVHTRVVEDMVTFSEGLGLEVKGTCESPLRGPAGNREFFLYATMKPRENKIGTGAT
ncbi:MAG: TlyA family RNA methyltransferase [Syntrophobacterales bacterium]|nr:MAG: TlyA family RNA methyltransferase [Syntrophobacterales bacterium]